jgi:phage terminase large subunit-like protein
MMEWTTACPDWAERIVDGRSLIPCGALFPEEGAGALEVFKQLRLVDVPNRPTFGEAGDAWIFEFVEAVFGAYEGEDGDGQRKISEFFLVMAKKNGKSTLAAGVMLTALIRNWRQSNELIIVAPTIKAANNSFKPAADMVRADPRLSAAPGCSGFLHVIDNTRTIRHLKTGATLQILAADTGTVAGNKAAFVLVDELWEFGARSGADAMMREAAGGLVGRPEGFLISISTQSDRPPAGIWRDKLDYARKVRDGAIVDPKFLPVIYEFPDHMLKSEQYLEPENYYITNPLIGRTAWGRDWIKKELAKENEKGPSTRNVFLAKHLNVEISGALRADGWSGARRWASGADGALTLEAILDRSEVVVVAADGGGEDDLFGLSVMGRDEKTKDWLSWSHAFISEGGVELRRANDTLYRQFQDDGDLTIVSHLPDDIDGIIEVVRAVQASGKFSLMGLDKIGTSQVLLDELIEVGLIANETLVTVPQGISLMGAFKVVGRKLADGSFKHCGGAMMNWCAHNVIIVPTPTGSRVARDASGYGKIDPWVAMIDCAYLMLQTPEAAGQSGWDTDDVDALIAKIDAASAA